MRSYAIGDVHGHLDKLRAAHALIEADRAECGDAAAPVIHLGDLVDRGPDSAGVVEYLCREIAEGAPWVVLKGNHDRLFAHFLEDPHWHDPLVRTQIHWLDTPLGGAATLASYGVRAGGRPVETVHAEALAAVPGAHRAFLRGLPLYAERGPLLFVHAGIRPGVALAAQAEDDLVWIREGFLERAEDFGRLVVHGHTALPAPTHFGNRVDLDGGAAYGRPLVPAVFEGAEAWLLTARGRQALRPPG